MRLFLGYFLREIFIERPISIVDDSELISFELLLLSFVEIGDLRAVIIWNVLIVLGFGFL